MGSITSKLKLLNFDVALKIDDTLVFVAAHYFDRRTVIRFLELYLIYILHLKVGMLTYMFQKCVSGVLENYKLEHCLCFPVAIVANAVKSTSFI